MCLANGKKGKGYVIDTIVLEWSISRRLQALGITKGTKVTILNRKRNGSIIFSVRGARLAVGKQIAAGIIVLEAGL